MPQQSFIYGGNAPGAISYEEMQRQRELAQALAGRVGSAAPSNIGEGLSAIGAALASRKYRKRATEAETAGRAQAAEQFGQMAQQTGLDPAMLGALNNPYMTDGQKAVVDALVRQKMAPAAVPEAPDIETLYDENGGEYKGAWNPETGQFDRIGGVKRKDKYRPLNPDEVKTLGLPAGNYQMAPDGQIKQIGDAQPQMTVYGPDGQPIMVQGNGKPMTEGQSKDTVYSTKAKGALDAFEPYADALTDFASSAGGELPVVGNYLKSPEYQMAEQAGEEFLSAVLRKETGAAITKEEQSLYGNMYLPRPGDKKEVLEYKRAARQRALAAIEAGMNPQQIIARENALKRLKAGEAAPAPVPAPEGEWQIEEIPEGGMY
jgi:hypothetical protein